MPSAKIIPLRKRGSVASTSESAPKVQSLREWVESLPSRPVPLKMKPPPREPTKK